MWKNYLKIAWRNLWKNKLYSFLNITGLSIGMAVCIAILLFVKFEENFDAFHTKNIYRLNEVQNWEGMVAPQKVALSMVPMGPTLVEDYPDVRNFVRIMSQGEEALKFGEKKLTLPKVLWADSSFFQMLDFPLLQGDPEQALVRPNSIVLSSEMAERIFGSEPAIGKTLTQAQNDTVSFTVTGIVENVSKNSHIQFDALTSMTTYLGPNAMDNWGSNWVTTYLELGENADLEYLEGDFPDYLVRHMGVDMATGYELFLQPMNEVHAKSADITHDYINFQKFDGNYSEILFYIALIVLVIAAINFINLTSAKSITRALEIGVRKASGASKSQLHFQFLGESVLVCLIALTFALVLVTICLPFLSQFSDRQLDFPVLDNPVYLLGLIGGAVFIGIVSGLYPAFYLSKFQPTKILKGTLESGSGKSNFRNVLVVVQFSAAIVLIISTLFGVRQLNYLQNKDLGFSHEQVITIPFNGQWANRYESLKQDLLSSSMVKSVTSSSQRLGNNLHQTSAVFRGGGEARGMATSHVVVDPDFLNLYEIELLAGRNFDKSTKSDEGNSYLINESMAQELLSGAPNLNSMEDLLGSKFGLGWNGMDTTGQIIGIVKDFNFNSLHNKIETLTILNKTEWANAEISVKMAGNDIPESLAQIENIWNSHMPEREFEYKFLDEHFQELYRSDQTLNVIITLLTALSILISCLGLFGLASFVTEQRTKEIGIRKVLGASEFSVVSMLSKDFVKLVLVAIILGSPIAYFAVNSWLSDFAFKIDISWWVFVLAGLGAILLALGTVSFQAVKAAWVNPVDSLKSE